MKIKTILGKQKVVAGRGHNLDVLIRLQAPEPPAEAKRAPLALLPIVDVSGSMEGGKLDAVKKALLLLIDHLAPGDLAGLVIFDDKARAVVPLVELAESSRNQLRAAIRALTVGGSTNLAGGFLAGMGLSKQASLPVGLRTRLILLTDGQANTGVATEAHELRALVREHLGACSLSTFGYGADCDHSMLSDLAEEGRGSFAYIENDDIVRTAFARELGGLVSTHAEDVRLRLVPSAGAPSEASLGDLLYRGELSFCAELALPQHAAAEGIEVARVFVSYRDLNGKEQELSTSVRVDYVAPGKENATLHPEVARARDERLVQIAQAAAEVAAQKGDFNAAHNALAAVVEKLTQPDLAAFVKDELLPAYQSSQDFVAASPLRGAAKQALKKRRLLTAPASLPSSLELMASEGELAMEKKFEEGS